MFQHTVLPMELQEIITLIEEKSRSVGLDFFPTLFELVDYQQLNEIAAYGGFPTRYPHWRWGMEYERISKSYTYGLSIIYEMVINNNPCYAYLLRANSLSAQKTVIAHVFAHCDFFKNNYWFSKTNRKMLDQMANHAAVIRNFINDVGHEEVENFVDVCLSLENLIDIQAPFKHTPAVEKEDAEGKRIHVAKMQSKSYMDQYVNPKDYLEQQEAKLRLAAETQQRIPEEPESDVLKFLLEYAPIPAWKKKVLRIIRDESYYFAPQGQTKILNEGWASYWHSKMMTEICPLDPSEIIDYCDHNAGVIANHPGQLNPYRLGVELLRHVERRWNRGQFGIDYLNCQDRKKRKEWDTQAGLGQKKIFEVRKFHNDITFIDEFLDEDFCHDAKMFLYDFDPRTGKSVISSRDFASVKAQLLLQLTNFGQPTIKVIDGNFHNRNELLLRHLHEGVDLKEDFAVESLQNIHKIWTRPVHLETVIEKVPKRIQFDGTTHTIEKM